VRGPAVAEIKDLRRDLVAKLPTGTVDLADRCPVMAAGSIRVCPLADPPACPSSSIFPKGTKQFVPADGTFLVAPLV